MTEQDSVIAGSFYAASKLATEELIRPYAALMGVDVLRIFTPYGPGQKNMLMANMIESVREGREITLSGDEGLWLTPIYLDDLCRIIIGLLHQTCEGFQVYNLGGDERVSLKQVVDQIAGLLGVEARIKHDNSRAVVSVAADSRKIYDASKCKPVIDLKSGINFIIHGKQ